MAEASVSPLLHHQDATTRHLVHVAGWAVMLLGSAIGLLLMFDEPVQPVRIALNFVAGAVGGTALLLARLGRWTQATHLLVWGVWVSVSLVAARNGGVNGPNLLNYPVIIVLAGWLLGVRATLTLVGLTALLFMGFIWADVQGMFKPVQVANRVAGGGVPGGHSGADGGGHAAVAPQLHEPRARSAADRCQPGRERG